MPLVIVVTLLLAACSSSPSAATAPPPPSYPQMVGGWGGTMAYTVIRTIGEISGRSASMCNETWLVTSQDRHSYAGTYQTTPSAGTTGCAGSGSLQGSVTPGGEVRLTFRGDSPSACKLLRGDPDFAGFVSPSGGLTAQRAYVLRCPSLASRYGGPATQDEQYNVTVSMSKR
jgi:hypothetical protein